MRVKWDTYKLGYSLEHPQLCNLFASNTSLLSLRTANVCNISEDRGGGLNFCKNMLRRQMYHFLFNLMNSLLKRCLKSFPRLHQGNLTGWSKNGPPQACWGLQKQCSSNPKFIGTRRFYKCPLSLGYLNKIWYFVTPRQKFLTNLLM
jgi:hypothetical protein